MRDTDVWRILNMRVVVHQRASRASKKDRENYGSRSREALRKGAKYDDGVVRALPFGAWIHRTGRQGSYHKNRRRANGVF